MSDADDFDLPEERRCSNPDYHDYHDWGPATARAFCPGIVNPADLEREWADEWRQMPDPLRRVAMRVNRVERYLEMETPAPTTIVEHARALVKKGLPGLREWLVAAEAEYADADLSLLGDPEDPAEK